MPTDHNIRQLIINKMTDAQYEQAVKSADELYLTPDSGSGGGTDLPDQTGQSGKFLTTNGSTLSWGSVPAGTVTSVRVQATSPVVSSVNTAQTTSLNTTISLADGYGDTKNPYASKTANTVLAAPNGSNGAPSFRALVKADIPLASETAASGGTTTSLVTTGEKYTWNNKQDALSAQTAYTSKGTSSKVPQITTNTLGQVTGITEVDITHQSIKTLNTDNTTAQSTSSSEAVAGSGTINLHKISKTGTFSDLLSKPTSISGYGITDAYTKTEVDGLISSVYKPAGSVAFASLPTLASGVLGNVYNVTDAFTTTTDFVEGSGKSYPAGTNVVVVEPTSGTYKFDVLAGFVDLSGYVPTSRKVNNKALSADITLTASDVGALPDNTTIPQGTVTSVRVQAGTGLSSSTSTAQNTTLNTTISIASGYKLPTTTEWNSKQDALPSQSGNSGKFLTTNGSTMSWATVDALPSQSGQSGKFLTTDGTNASWEAIQSGSDIDNSTITKNTNDELQTVGVKDARTDNTIKTWTGTKAQYDAIVSNIWSTPVQGPNFSSTWGWDSVTYGDNKFVVLSRTGYISTSTDGTNWTTAAQDTNLGNNTWCALVYGNNKFVALTEDGEISTSIDGINWTPYTYNQNLGDRRWSSLAYGDNKFVALDEVGYVSYSVDGTTWQTSVLNSNLDLQNGELGFWESLAYDGTKFVALSTGAPSLAYVSTSVDGVVWTSRISPSELQNSMGFMWNGGFNYTGTELLAIRHEGSISTSTDGTTWTEPILTANLSSASNWVSLACGNNKYVAITYQGYISMKDAVNNNMLYNVINDGLYLGTTPIANNTNVEWTYDSTNKILEIS